MGEQLALTLTTHLQEINQDNHLCVRWYPQPFPGHEGLMQNDQAWLDGWRQRAGLDNYGSHKAEGQPGNVGYLDRSRIL